MELPAYSGAEGHIDLVGGRTHCMVDQPLDRETVNAIDRFKMLIGFMPLRAVQQTILQSETFWATAEDEAEEIDLAAIETEWEEAKDAIEPLAYDLEDVAIEPLPDDPEVKAHIEELAEMEFFTDTYGDTDEHYELGMVPIDHLIARQASITVTGHREIPSWSDDPLGVIAYTLPKERHQGVFQQAIQSSDNSMVGYQFTSRAPNISIHDVSIVDTGQPMMKSILFRLRAPPNIVNVWRVNDRLLLNNGYHRIYQLMSQGETHAPAVIRDSDKIRRTGDFTEEELLGDRPPVLPDFESDISTTIRKPATNDLIRITAESTEVYR